MGLGPIRRMVFWRPSPGNLTMIDLTVVESIFFAALEKASDPERAAFLDETCGNDTDVRQHVERLLAAYPQAEGFLGAPAAEGLGMVVPLRERPGTVIGLYKLL